MKKSGLDYIVPQLRRLAVPIESLTLDPQNARRHPERNLEMVKRSLADFKQRKPIVVQAPQMIVRAGNGMLEVARQLGWTHIAAVVVEEDDVHAAAYAIIDNRSGESSEWDPGVLVAGLDEIGLALPDLLPPDIYFSLDEIQTLREEAIGNEPEAGEVDPDSIPAPPDKAITQPGDLWLLGEHRLLCGLAESPDDLDRLLAGTGVDLVNTDPPYNVKVEPRSNNAIAAGLSSFKGLGTHQSLNMDHPRGARGLKKEIAITAADAAGMHHQGFDLARHHAKAHRTTRKLRPKDRPLEGDYVSEVEFARMLLGWFGNMARVLKLGRSFYIWGGYANIANYPLPLRASGLYFSQMIVWDKEHPVLTRKDFMGAHEWCFYGWREGHAHRFLGPPNVPDLWHVKKVAPQHMVHLTEKPVELAIRAMQYSSRPGEAVLDLFGGSGSTMIAAQQTGRRCFLMDKDRLYCDVMVQRWQEFTGQKAIREPAVRKRHRGKSVEQAESD